MHEPSLLMIGRCFTLPVILAFQQGFSDRNVRLPSLHHSITFPVGLIIASDDIQESDASYRALNNSQTK